MATQDDVRRIALALPQIEEGEDHFAFSVPTRGKQRGFAWVWMERVAPKKPRVAQPAVLAIRVANIEEKEALLALGEECYFTEPHYNGFPAILVRLAAVEYQGFRPDEVPLNNPLVLHVIRARIFARSQGLHDGAEASQRRNPPAEWAAPPLADSLQRMGGLDNILRRVDTFLGSPSSQARSA